MPTTAEQLHALLHRFDKTRLPEIQKAAEAGDPRAQFQLGALYANGKGVSQDSDQALHWLRAAAEQGWVAAQTLLGWCYVQREGFVHDPSEAHRWYSSAAEHGDVDAMCALGDLYAQGAGAIEKNTQAMLHWYQQAANNNHPKAQYMLGKLLAEGSLVAQNDEAAFQWLSLAIISGSELAQKELAMLSARVDSETLQDWKDRMLAQMQPTH
ncbi:MAG: tetratricopeptide repeat protein [Thiohalomonadaceae bacterium]